jgi:maltooligosyltrehalose trehalohydrolase
MATFQRCKLDLSERTKSGRNRATYDLFRDLLRLRREDPVFAAQDSTRLQGAVLGPRAFLLRFAVGSGDDRLVLVNLGDDINAATMPEPLVAPPAGGAWTLLFSSEDLKYGGAGTPPIDAPHKLLVPAGSTLVLAPSRSGRVTKTS